MGWSPTESGPREPGHALATRRQGGPGVAEGCGWVYKILPYIEQTAVYSNYQFNVPIPTIMDPGRATTGLSIVPFNPSDVGGTQYRAGQVTDYAANALVIGSGLNTA